MMAVALCIADVHADAVLDLLPAHAADMTIPALATLTKGTRLVSTPLTPGLTRSLGTPRLMPTAMPTALVVAAAYASPTSFMFMGTLLLAFE